MNASGSRVVDLAVAVTHEEVLRGLGYRHRGPSRRVRERLDGIWLEGLALLRPRGAFSLVGEATAAALAVPEPGVLVGLGACTIGEELETEVARRTDAGRPLDALLLDALGSVAAEASADALNQELCRVAQGRGLRTGPRSSPGYPGWGLEHQRDLLAALPVEAIGISLTESLMMVPRKSVSFAVAFHAHAVARDPGRCARCERRDCAFRVASPLEPESRADRALTGRAADPEPRRGP